MREVEKQKALDRELNRKRNTMSAREKSDLINGTNDVFVLARWSWLVCTVLCASGA
jgi:hypothetical protein